MKCIRPTYINNFQCDGKTCGSRCCKGWRVVVEDETYKKFCAIEDENERQEILSEFDQSDDKKIFVKLKDNLDCPFLDEDYLCKIQKRHGEEYLTAICHSYPRVIYKLDNILEESMTLTCPIAEKLILLPKMPIEFEEIEIDPPRGIFDRTNKIKLPVEESISIQATATAILQSRNMSFNERLLRLCLLLQDNKFVGKINLDFDADRHAEIMIDIFAEMYDTNMSDEKKLNLKKIYLNYNETILARLMNNYAHIFENYLVNEFFMRCYPFAFDGGLWNNCKIFITSYKAMEFAIILTAISKNGFVSEDEFLTMIDAINEKLDHNRGGMKAICNFAEKINDIEGFINISLNMKS